MAIVPPSPVYEAANQWKEFFQEEFHSRGALRSPPHITLHMPFEWKTSKEKFLKDELTKFASNQKPFEIKLSNFACFEPRVIFIAVGENERLKEMQAALFRFCKMELNLFHANRQDKPFHPHLTVASRDLRKADFPNAWAHVSDKKFTGNFLVNDFALLKHNRKNWDLLERFPWPTSTSIT